MIKVVCGSTIIDAPHTPSPLVYPVSSLPHHPHQFPRLTPLRKFLWTPLLMEATFAVTPRHDYQHVPHPEASLGNELGNRIRKSHNKSSAQGAHRARAGQIRCAPPEVPTSIFAQPLWQPLPSPRFRPAQTFA